MSIQAGLRRVDQPCHPTRPDRGTKARDVERTDHFVEHTLPEIGRYLTPARVRGFGSRIRHVFAIWRLQRRGLYR